MNWYKIINENGLTMMNNKQNKVICVLGMHRSGTSMLMRLLNICGVYVGGDQDMIPTTNDNKKGFWEHKKVLEINKEILKIFNGRWNEPPILKDGWENDSRLDELYIEAKKFVDEMNKINGTWGFKEPRTCLTLPFWQKIIPDMLYVISFRDPGNVAKSLYKRNNIIHLDGILLWIFYWKSIIKYTKNKNRCFVCFDNFFLNWQKELNGVIKFINEKDVTIDSHENEIINFINPALKHNNMIVNNINLNNITNETILEYALIAYSNTDKIFVQLQTIKQNKEKIIEQNKIIEQKNIQLKQKNQQLHQINKKYTIIKKSKSFRIGDLCFRSIKKPYKLVLLPINLIKIFK